MLCASLEIQVQDEGPLASWVGVLWHHHQGDTSGCLESGLSCFHMSFSISLASLVVLNLENPPCPPTALPFKIVSQCPSHLEES